MSSLESTHFLKPLTLISHARCTIPPYISEEVSIQQLSDSFRNVILGDIHTTPKLPQDNVHYATSPTSITFSKHKKGAHGYLVFTLSDNTIQHTPMVLPTKVLITPTNLRQATHILQKRDKNFRKVRFIGSPEELRDLHRLPTKNIVKDFILKDEIIDDGLAENSLKDFLSSNVSISEFAFSYFKDTLRIREQSLINIKILYERFRSKKCVHRK